MELYPNNSAKLIEYLLQIKSIEINTEELFEWASSIKSPIYCDNRKTLSFPNIRNFIRQELSNLINEKFSSPDYIVGVATAGIPHGVLVAEELGLPFLYVRNESKSHGLRNKIEGSFEKGRTVIVVEDIISTGKSSLQAIENLLEAGLQVKGLVSILNYNFITSKNKFKNICPVFSLASFNDLIAKAKELEYIDDKDKLFIEKWKKSVDLN